MQLNVEKPSDCRAFGPCARSEVYYSWMLRQSSFSHSLCAWPLKIFEFGVPGRVQVPLTLTSPLLTTSPGFIWKALVDVNVFLLWGHLSPKSFSPLAPAQPPRANTDQDCSLFCDSFSQTWGQGPSVCRGYKRSPSSLWFFLPERFWGQMFWPNILIWLPQALIGLVLEFSDWTYDISQLFTLKKMHNYKDDQLLPQILDFRNIS